MLSLNSLLGHGREDDPALFIPHGPVLSYGRLRGLVEEAALEMRMFGVASGDRVAMAFDNGPEAIVFFLAAANVATACPLNPAYTESEFRYYLNDIGARYLIVPPKGAHHARNAIADGGTIIEAEINSDGRLLIESRARARPQRSIQSGEDDDVALILHTSGTTSRPKRVPLRSRNVIASVTNIASHYRLGPQDVSLCVMPLFHVHGLVAAALSTLATGGTVVVPRRFTAAAFWPAARLLQPTWFTASPTPHHLIMMRSRQSHVAARERLRFVRSCSSALSPALMEQMEQHFGVPVLEAYGMTEACHQMASNPLPPGRRVPGSVGFATGVDVAVLDEHGTMVTTGTPGEVCIRGPNVIDWYEDNAEANAASFTQGWFRTGDQGVLDTDAYLRLIGRIKELINRGGEKIAPREVDEVLELHPGVTEAVCFGVPHSVWGEEVEVAVVLSEPVSERALIAHCRQYLADFKVPTHVHIVKDIPRTPTGKVQRRHVASQLASK
jgi:acyl-CoA synthetase (AMP-forming)/AMP-acid ligase II